MPRSATLPRWSIRWRDLGVGALVWGGVLVLFVSFRALDPTGPDLPADLLLRRVTLACALWVVITPLVLALAERFPVEAARPWRHAPLHLALGLLVAVGLDAVTQVVISPGGSSASETASGRSPLPAQVRVLSHLFVFGMLLAAGHARAYLVRSRAREAEAARLSALLATARLDALRMQLHPHFLFNTLNAIAALAERDPAGVRRVVARLSGLLRRVLDPAMAREVTLGDEVAFLDDYLDIQRVRLGDRLATVLDVPEDVRGALVPALVLQPLVENAVEHGVARLEDRPGTVRVAAWRDGPSLVVRVSDDGPGVPPGDAADEADGEAAGDREGGIGLGNTRARLQALYGADATVDAGTPPEGGFRATLRLPFHTVPLAP